MKLIHYQTVEAVASEELAVLQEIAEEFNARRPIGERIRLWRKDQILACMRPAKARWGFTSVENGGREQVLRAIERMSSATPRLTWVLYEEGNGDQELMLKGGMAGVR